MDSATDIECPITHLVEIVRFFENSCAVKGLAIAALGSLEDRYSCLTNSQSTDPSRAEITPSDPS